MGIEEHHKVVVSGRVIHRSGCGPHTYPQQWMQHMNIVLSVQVHSSEQNTTVAVLH